MFNARFEQPSPQSIPHLIGNYDSSLGSTLPFSGRRGSNISNSLMTGTGLDQHLTGANLMSSDHDVGAPDDDDDDAVVFDNDEEGDIEEPDIGERQLPPLEVIVSHQMGSREILNVDDSEEGTSFV